MKTISVRRKVAYLSSALVPAGFAGSAVAADYSTISGVSFAGIDTAVMAVSASLAAIYIVVKGAKIVLSMFKGA